MGDVAGEDGVACAPTGASEAIMAWICSIRATATAALMPPSGARWIASAISSSATAARLGVGGLVLGAVALLEALEDLAALLARRRGPGGVPRSRRRGG